MSSLSLVAARHAIGVATGADLAQAAEDALVAGVDSMDLAVLAFETDPAMSYAAPLFERGLRDLSIEIPPKAEACWVVLRHLMSRIVNGSVSPRAGVQTILDDVYYPCCDLNDQTARYKGESHGLQEILGNFYGIDDIEERPPEVSCDGKYGTEAIAAVESHIRQLAAEWLREYGT